MQTQTLNTADLIFDLLTPDETPAPALQPEDELVLDFEINWVPSLSMYEVALIAVSSISARAEADAEERPYSLWFCD